MNYRLFQVYTNLKLTTLLLCKLSSSDRMVTFPPMISCGKLEFDPEKVETLRSVLVNRNLTVPFGVKMAPTEGRFEYTDPVGMWVAPVLITLM